MNLATSLDQIKGVGPKTAAELRRAGLETVSDILLFLPRKHEDFTNVTPIAELQPGKVTIRARCQQISTRPVRRGLRLTTAVLADDTSKLNAIWFNQPYRVQQLGGSDEWFYFSGEFEYNYGRYQLTNPTAELAKELPVQADRLLPVYHAVRGLKSQTVRKVIEQLRPLMSVLPETLPPSIVKSEKLLDRAAAISAMHFPRDEREVEQARQRLAFEELFELVLASQLNKIDNQKLAGFAIPFEKSVVQDFVKKLPFALTNAQRRAAWGILQDFENARPMNRLLQGDVGSGLAARQAANAGYQTAFMAPTEILARQHAQTLAKLLEPFDVAVGLLIGSVKGKARQTLYQQIASGAVDVVVGTHALIQDKVEFHRLGFVVIDEQHRFGVEQRQKLLMKVKDEEVKSGALDTLSEPMTIAAGSSRETGRAAPGSRARHGGEESISSAPLNAKKPSITAAMPHLLAMTATPIPRSLALTVYGELDVSVLDERPRGRRPILTKIISPPSREAAYTAIDQQIAQGRQAYVVCSLIADSDSSDRKSVEAEYKRLKNSIFGRRRIAMLHGKMTASEKDQIMQAFKDQKYDILVSTTVIEVGVDVPNATIMMIEDADQFGLAQLHQLRGRVGRGQHQSFCYLMMSTNNKPSQRLREIEQSNDGFHLAEVDMSLRGPGEIYGRMQHGALNLQIATLADTQLIARAQKAAKRFIDSGESLSKYPALEARVRHNQRVTTLN